TWRFDQPVVITARNANHAVRPEEIAQQIRIAREIICEPGDFLRPRGTDDRRRRFQVVTGTIAKSVFAPAFIAVPPFHRMAEAADLRCPQRIDLFRMHDLAPEGWRIGRPVLVPLGRPGVDVALAGPMAGLTGNPQLTGPRVHRPSLAVCPWLDSRRVASAANDIPHFRPVRRIRRPNKSRVAWH